MKLEKMNPALIAALLPLAEVMVTGAGKLWDVSRDAFVIAKGYHGDPQDASTAIRTVIVEKVNGNPGSVKGYLSTLVWLDKNGHDYKGISKGDADNLRYPKQPKLAPADTAEGIAQRRAKLDAKEKELREADEEAAKADKADPRRVLLRQVSATIGALDLNSLEIVAAMIFDAVADLNGEKPQEGEKPERQAA